MVVTAVTRLCALGLLSGAEASGTPARAVTSAIPGCDVCHPLDSVSLEGEHRHGGDLIKNPLTTPAASCIKRDPVRGG